MKSVMLSIKPYWLFLIIAKKMGWNIGKEKTVEVRKSYPKDNDWNKTVNLYCTKDIKSFRQIPKEYQPQIARFLGKVIGNFLCDKIVWVISHPTVFAGHDLFHEAAIKAACLTDNEAEKYAKGKDLYGWHISDLVIYDKPKELSEFTRYCGDECPNEDCKYLDGMRGYEYDERDCACNFYKPIERPPQSWCYVEEL